MRPNRRGQVILLNGTSSSGKGSIARELLDLLDPPHFHLSIDAFNAMRSKEAISRLSESELEEALRRTRGGFHRAVAGMAHAGNDVVMDYVFSEPWRLSDCLEVFEGLRVVFVGVHCQLEELERREKARGDRNVGLARSQLEVVHSFVEYDIEVRSDQMSPRDAAAVIGGLLQKVGSITAFDRLRTN